MVTAFNNVSETGAGTEGLRSKMPYPGLRAFERWESDIFFGREDQVTDLVDKLLTHKFLIVTGASGCGKSSLVKTGLLNALQPYGTPAAEREWLFIEFRPGIAPVWELAGAVVRAAGDQVAGPHNLPSDWARKQMDLRIRLLGRGIEGFRDALENGVFNGPPLFKPGHRILVLADQFEEVFRYGVRESHLSARAFHDEAVRMVNILLGRQPNGGNDDNHMDGGIADAIHVVITMRTEYLDRCGEFDGLLDAINTSFAVATDLSGKDLWRAIVGPASKFDGEVQARLAHQLLNEAEETKFDRLPLLQHALMRSWLFAQPARPGAKIRMMTDDYKKAGSLLEGTAVSRHADEAYFDLREAGKGQLTEIIFRELTERPIGFGTEAGRDKRRPRRVADLAAVAGLEGDRWRQMIPTIERFSRPDTNFIVVRSGPECADGDGGARSLEDCALSLDSVIDISHEALIRNWKKLSKWVEQEAEDGHLLIQYSAFANRYAGNCSPPCCHGRPN